MAREVVMVIEGAVRSCGVVRVRGSSCGGDVVEGYGPKCPHFPFLPFDLV